MNQNLPKVLVVEDEKSFVEALKVGLDREGFDVKVAEDGLMALNLFRIFKPDLILLDVMLPKISGLDVCKEIRTESKVPIIMVTAKGEEIDTVVGLEVGADDYVTKPYRLREVVARMRSLLRRSNWSDETEAISEGRVITVSDIQIYIDKYEVKVRNEIVDFPLKEFELLLILLENVGRVLTRDVLIDQVWGFDYVGDTKTLDVHIKRLRTKVEKDPSKPQSIITVRGVGYKFVNTNRP